MAHAAVEAGLGTLGLNGQLLTPEFGPRLMLTIVLCSLDVEPDQRMETALCKGPECGRCLSTCPGDVVGHWDRDWMACDRYRSPHGFQQVTEFLGRVLAAPDSETQADLVRSEDSFNLWQSTLRGAGVITGCRRCQDVCPIGEDYQAMLADALDEIPEDNAEKPGPARGDVPGGGGRRDAGGSRTTETLDRQARLTGPAGGRGMPLELPTSAEDIQAIQSARKRVAVERALAAPFHRDRIPRDIDLDRLDEAEEWRRIPILDKEMLRALPPKQFNSEFCQAPVSEIAELWRSGGATGVPLFYPRSFEDMRYGRLSFARVLQCAGIGPGDLAHVSFPLGIHPVGHLMARAAQALRIGVNWAGAGNSTPSEAQINLLTTLEPTVWMGMSSYGLHLANMAEARGIDLAAGSVRRLICSAEQVTEAKRRRIEKIWGAEMYDSFGMTEAGMMGAEGDAHDGFHIWTDMYFIEVLDRETLCRSARASPGSWW